MALRWDRRIWGAGAKFLNGRNVLAVAAASASAIPNWFKAKIGSLENSKILSGPSPYIFAKTWRLNRNHLEEGNYAGAQGRIVQPVGFPHDDGDLTDDEIGGRGQTNFCPKSRYRNGPGEVGVGVEDGFVGRREFR